MASKIWRNLIRTAAAACFVVGSSTQAGGVFYQSDFDPEPFAVKVVFRVDDACVRNPYVSANGWPSSSAGCTVTLWNVTATLRHFDGEGRDETDVDDIAYLDLVTPDDPYDYPQIIRGAYFAGGELAGIDWVLDFLLPLVPVPPIGPEVVDGSDYLDGKYWIRFKNERDGSDGSTRDLIPESVALLYKETKGCIPRFFGGCIDFDYPALVPGDGGRAVVVPLVPGGPLYTNLGSTKPDDYEVDGTPIFRQAEPIPEPGSLALLGGALIAGWFTRRRKVAA